MPANVTHMLIAHKALQKLKAKGVDEFTEFAGMLDDTSRDKNYKAYVNLGSLGPDLFYYVDIGRSIKDILIDRFVRAKAMTPWSYHLHSQKPNEFPLKLIGTVFNDAIRRNGKIVLCDDDIRKLAYIAGHLTHMAADQIIHPIVNRVAGPSHSDPENWRKHRECEVFQDYFLYMEVYRLEEKSGPKYEFLRQPFHDWIDCVRRVPSTKDQFGYLLESAWSLKWNIWSLMRYITSYIRVAAFGSTEEWFRDFLRRGFVDTYGACPSEEEIKDSVDYLRLALRVCRKFGPYKKADKEHHRNKERSGMYQEYIKDVGYIRYYRLAVELAVIYLIALYEVYFVLKEGRDFTNMCKKRFLSIVSDADLSCPLKWRIVEQALAELMNKRSTVAATRISSLLVETKFLTTNHVFEATNDVDIVKA